MWPSLTQITLRTDRGIEGVVDDLAVLLDQRLSADEDERRSFRSGRFSPNTDHWPERLFASSELTRRGLVRARGTSVEDGRSVGTLDTARHDHHRTRGTLQQRVRHAAEKHAAQRAVATGAQHEQP